jgi:proton glutamate symport protein
MAMTSSPSRYAARLPLWVLVGGTLGILTGLFFGDDAALLRPIGTTYVKLMEVVVFPYIICSLLHGLGRLLPDTAWRLFRCSWLIYLGLWGLTFLIIFLLSFAIPLAPAPSFIDASAPEKSLGLLDLLIPANPFLDLVRNHLPAIVIFSIIYGIAIQRVENKEAFLSVLSLIRAASVTIWHWVVLLAPFGVFALFADTAGTLAPAALADLSLYLVTLMFGTLILAFWILPSIMAALCPMSTREVLRDLQGALVIAVVTSLSVAALPFIQQATEKLARRMAIEDEDCGEIIKTSLAVSYPLAQLGNFFIWLFVLFAAFYYRIPLSLGEQAALPVVSLLSGFGSPHPRPHQEGG